jgi:DHA2 family multidrug resistance protein-like MFS transporter
VAIRTTARPITCTPLTSPDVDDAQPDESQTESVTAEAVPRAGRREWVGLAVIALPCLLYSMDLTVLYLAVPSLTADLDPSSTELLWITDIYGFFLAGFLITMGTLGDRIGRRRLLLIGAAAFGVTSVIAAFSASVEMLIISRALMGVAAAALAPSTLSLIRNMFLQPRQRTFAISVWATSFSVGAALGPLLGGLLLEFFWWGSVFLLAVPVMALLLVLGPRLLPEYRDPDAGRLDLVSAGLSIAAVLAVIYGLKRIAESGFDWSAALSIAAGLGVALVFLGRQRVLTDPLIDLSLFRSRSFNASLASNTLSLAIAFGIFLFIAQYLQLVLGLSPFEAGLWTVPSAGGFIAGSMLAPVIVRRVRPAFAVAGGLALAAVGLGLLTQVEGDSQLALVVTGSIVIALGVAPPVTLGTDLIVGSVRPERAGVASGLSETGAELGGALGIALLGSLGVAVYRDQMATLPIRLAPEQADAAGQTLGGAVDVVEGLGRARGTALLESAQEAFTQGMQLAAVVAAAVAVGTAVLAALFLPRVGVGSPPEQSRGADSDAAVEAARW